MRFTSAVTTSSGKPVSRLGLGGGSFGSMYNRVLDRERSVSIIKAAYDAGINYFDTAPYYGFNNGSSEQAFGEALHQVDRSSYFMATKVGFYEKEVLKRWDYSAERVEDSVKNSLRNLQMECIDLIQIHEIEIMGHLDNIDMILHETLPALDRLRQRGLCRKIGITTYDPKWLKLVVERSPVKLDSVLSYARLTLFDYELKNYAQWFKDRRLALINASPLGLSLLVTDESHELQLNSNPEVYAGIKEARKICRDNSVAIEDIALGYCTQEGEKIGVDVLLTGCSTIEEVRCNIDVFEKGLNAKQSEVCKTLLKGPFGPHITQRHVVDWTKMEVAEYKKLKGL